MVKSNRDTPKDLQSPNNHPRSHVNNVSAPSCPLFVAPELCKTCSSEFGTVHADTNILCCVIFKLRHNCDIYNKKCMQLCNTYSRIFCTG